MTVSVGTHLLKSKPMMKRTECLECTDNCSESYKKNFFQFASNRHHRRLQLSTHTRHSLSARSCGCYCWRCSERKQGYSAGDLLLACEDGGKTDARTNLTAGSTQVLVHCSALLQKHKNVASPNTTGPLRLQSSALYNVGSPVAGGPLGDNLLLHCRPTSEDGEMIADHRDSVENLEKL